MEANTGQCFSTLEKVIYVEWGPWCWGLSLHLIKVVNLKIPMTITAGLQQTVQTVGRVFGNEMFWWFCHYFSPLCDALSCAYKSAKILSCFFLPGLFHAQWPYLCRLKCKRLFWKMIPKSASVSSVSFCSTLGIPTVTLNSSACRQTSVTQ